LVSKNTLLAVGANCFSHHRTAAAYVVLTAFLLVVPLCANAGDSVSAEYRTKANFLTAVPKFVEWPESSFGSAKAPLVVCVIGDFHFGTALAELAQNAPRNGRRIEVLWVRKDEQLRTCHVLFVSGSEANRYPKIVRSVQGAGILTIGETKDFLSDGGMLSFSFRNESLQFEVNLAPVTEARLRVSSRLLALAQRVAGNPESSMASITAERTK
jgi:hypothetical protein